MGGVGIYGPHIHQGKSAMVHYFENHEGSEVAFVCMYEWQGKARESVYALLVHEAVHIWQRMCEIMGEREPSSEFEAYCVQAISQRLFMEFERQVGRANN